METDPSSRDSSPSPTPGTQLGDSVECASCPSPMAGIGGTSVRKLTHSETIDGVSGPHFSVYNQSVRAWMWSRGTLSCKRALSEQSGDGHNHLWHPPSAIMGKQTKRTSAPQVRLLTCLLPSIELCHDGIQPLHLRLSADDARYQVTSILASPASPKVGF
ncbi:hypothetical protein OUZ56_000914 [Daphnia magna]|uniref:Uncharacterized protein n=1 Tax=Daphnia magna TaxID=35525 RepID=A0ABR0A140_9CRUS|nr:hypothetical protein OUZ56_000914 [Daphnia magna]